MPRSFAYYGPMESLESGKKLYRIKAYPKISGTLNTDWNRGVHIDHISKSSVKRTLEKVESIVNLPDQERESALDELKKELLTSGKRGRKPYSREALLSLGSSVWPVTSTRWGKLDGLPTYSTIKREFGSWKRFGEAIETELSKRIKLQRIDATKSAELEELVIEAVGLGRFENDTQVLYHITEEARQRLDNRTINPRQIYDVYKRIPEERRGILRSSTTNTLTLETFSKVRDFLTGLDKGVLERYGQPAGAYLLARDINKEDRSFTPYLGHLFLMVRDKTHIQDLTRIPESELPKWNPRYMDLRFEDTETLVNFLKRKYRENSDEFFQRYGSKTGTKNLVSDLMKEVRLDLGNKKVHSFIGDSRAVSTAMEIGDRRFETEWNPRVILLDEDNTSMILDHLRGRYQYNPDKFFEIYGSEIGGLLLAIELQQTHETNISPMSLSTLTGNGIVLEELLDLEDVRFRREWKPRGIKVGLSDVQSLVDFLKEKYLENPEAFFHKYGSYIGALNLSRDLSKKGIKINPSDIQTVTGKGEFVSLLLGIKDERLSKWGQRKMPKDISLVNSSIALLRERYEENPDEFFQRYGSQEGMHDLALDLRECGVYRKRINLQELSQLFAKPSIAKEVLELSDERFETRWKPRMLNIRLDTLEDVLGFLREEYQKDPDKFFATYGGDTGVYRLAKKLKDEKEIYLHLIRLGTVVNKWELLSRMLGIEDERFETEWNPRSLQLNSQDLESVLDFMKRKYEEDPDVFFSRYGAKEGQVILGRDLKKETGKCVGYLNALVGNGQALSELMEVQDTRFETNWHTRILLNASQDRTELLLDFLRNKYEQDPDRFFAMYGSRSGVLEIARDLHREKKLDVQTHTLHNLIADGIKLANYIGIDRERFETDWKPLTLIGKFSQLEATLGFLRERHAEDPNEFYYRYGGAEGSITLVADMESEGHRNVNLKHLYYLLSPDILEEQLGIERENGLMRRRINVGSEEVRQIKRHMGDRYEQDPDKFFEVYGSSLGSMILRRELGLSDKVQLSTLVNNGIQLGQILGIEDERFKQKWQPRIPKQSEEAVLEGIESLAHGKALPNIDEPINQEVISYLRFRSKILRGLRGSGGIKYSTDNSANKELVLYFTDLFLPQYSYDVRRNLDSSIEKDRIALEELSELEIPSMDSPSTEGLLLDQFTLKAGKLLYSFDPGMRMEGYTNLVQLGGQHPLYKYYIKGDLAPTVQDVFETAIAGYDPYKLFCQGENKVLPLRNWLVSHLKFTKHIAMAQRMKENVSIDTGGYEDERMHGGRKPIIEFS